MKITAVLILLALVQPAFALAQATPPSPPVPTIEVTGNGEARANPDRATMDIAVETHGATAAQAAAQNAKLSQRIADALKAKLGDTGKIQTGSYNLMPEYRQKPERDYVASRRLSGGQHGNGRYQRAGSGRSADRRGDRRRRQPHRFDQLHAARPERTAQRGDCQGRRRRAEPGPRPGRGAGREAQARAACLHDGGAASLPRSSAWVMRDSPLGRRQSRRRSRRARSRCRQRSISPTRSNSAGLAAVLTPDRRPYWRLTGTIHMVGNRELARRQRLRGGGGNQHRRGLKA